MRQSTLFGRRRTNFCRRMSLQELPKGAPGAPLPEDYAHMLDGLRKAGWKDQAASVLCRSRILIEPRASTLKTHSWPPSADGSVRRKRMFSPDRALRAHHDRDNAESPEYDAVQRLIGGYSLIPPRQWRPYPLRQTVASHHCLWRGSPGGQ